MSKKALIDEEVFVAHQHKFLERIHLVTHIPLFNIVVVSATCHKLVNIPVAIFLFASLSSTRKDGPR